MVSSSGCFVPRPAATVSACQLEEPVKNVVCAACIFYWQADKDCTAKCTAINSQVMSKTDMYIVIWPPFHSTSQWRRCAEGKCLKSPSKSKGPNFWTVPEIKKHCVMKTCNRLTYIYIQGRVCTYSFVHQKSPTYTYKHMHTHILWMTYWGKHQSKSWIRESFAIGSDYFEI